MTEGALVQRFPGARPLRRCRIVSERTVENGIATKHLVHIGLENSTDVEIDGEHLKEGMPVVLTGNYELTSGMAVSPEKKP